MDNTSRTKIEVSSNFVPVTTTSNSYSTVKAKSQIVKKGKVVLVQATKAYSGKTCTAPLILNLSVGWR
jgi:RNase P subunit RPR2